LKVFTLGNSALGMQGFVTYGTQTESKNNNTVHEEKRLEGGAGGGGGERKAVWARGARRLDLT
jgi:hypothetical protein